ncbi:tetratricopeptide repeat protein [Thermodesulfobacteriota bacterium]
MAVPSIPEMKKSSYPLWKNILYGFLIFCLFFGSIELLLFLSGFSPALSDRDPYVGFAENIPLFIEETRDDGTRVMKTAPNKLSFFNYQEFPREKGPKYRIFCLGGSATYGRPYDDTTSFPGWLREFLNEAAPSKEWEVINAGGMSYAGYRVAALMEELVDYQPDLFIVYTGHNEFLEQRTYGDLQTMPQSLIRTTAFLSQTRTYSFLQQAYQGGQGEKSAGGRFIMEAEVDEILNYTVGPTSYVRDDTLREQIIDHFRVNLQRMVRLARSAGSDIVLVNPAVNFKDMSPFKSEHSIEPQTEAGDQWQQLYRQGEQLTDEGNYQEALELFDQALALDDRHAELWYRKGRVLFLLERYAEAREAFSRARDEDICPLRILSPMQQAIIEIARREQVAMLDFAGLLDEKSGRERGHAIPGKEYFLDHVHLTVAGYRILALALFDLLVEQGIVQPESSWGEADVQRITDRIEAGLDPQQQAFAVRNLGKVLGWAGRLEEAHTLFLLANEELGDDPGTLAELSRSSTRRGDIDQAIKYLEEAIAASDPQETRVLHRILGGLYEEQGRIEDAVAQYRLCLKLVDQALARYPTEELVEQLETITPIEEKEKVYRKSAALQAAALYLDVHERLGEIMSRLGRTGEAIGHYQAILTLKPEDGEVLAWLGSLLVRGNRFDQAVKVLEKALTIQPESPKLHYELGVAFERQGIIEQADTHYQAVIRLDPVSPEPYNNLGVFYARQGRMEEAAQLFAQALEIDPANREAKYNLNAARARIEAGRHHP